jgi:hypothetical protein
MPTAVQFRRGTTTEHSTFTGAAGELTVDTDKNTVVVHDGTTAGGNPLVTSGQTTVEFGDLTVTGNLTVTGTTVTVDTATAQTVDLGDGDRIRLGDDGDLEIYHDTLNSYVKDTGTGDLRIEASRIVVSAGSFGHIICSGVVGDVVLNKNGNARLQTTNDGVTITGELTADSTTINGPSHIHEIFERKQPATSTSGATDIYVNSGAIVRFSNDQTGNRTFNFVGDATTALNDIMTSVEVLTVAVLLPNGATPYYVSTVQIDGVSVTPKWSGGSAPAAGNANSTDIYSFTIIKTSDATFEVYASQQQYA